MKRARRGAAAHQGLRPQSGQSVGGPLDALRPYLHHSQDKSGYIDDREFVALAKAVSHGSPLFPSSFIDATDIFDANEDGVIDFEEFLQIDRRFPTMLYPTLQLQASLQTFTFGQEKWLSFFKEALRCYEDRERAKMFKPESHQSSGESDNVSEGSTLFTASRLVAAAQGIAAKVLRRRRRAMDVDVISRLRPDEVHKRAEESKRQRAAQTARATDAPQGQRICSDKPRGSQRSTKGELL